MSAHSSIARLALVLALSALPMAASGQTMDDPSHTEGLFLNVRTGGYGVAYKGDRDGSGEGFGLRAGYGFNERFTGYLGFEWATISEGNGFEGLPAGDDYTLIYIDLGGRFHFRNPQRWVPFLDVGASIVGLAYDTSENQEATYGGASATLGGGMLYFVSPRVALEGAASFTAGNLMERTIGGTRSDADIGVAGVRLHVGLSFFPTR